MFTLTFVYRLAGIFYDNSDKLFLPSLGRDNVLRNCDRFHKLWSYPRRPLCNIYIL